MHITEHTPDTLLTPGRVYRQLGCRAKCGKCACRFSQEILETGACQTRNAAKPVTNIEPAGFGIAAE